MSSFTPEGFEPAADMNHIRPENESNWSESYAFWAYWEDHYLYMHYQRHPDDSSMWRGYASVQCEDGRVITSHGFGRERSPFGPGYQQCHAVCERPFESYRVEVDSIAQVSDWKTLRSEVMPGLDENIVPLKMELQFISVSKTYAPMKADDNETHSSAKWTHYNACRVQGFVTIGNERKYIDTLGFRDHSAGPRSIGNMGSGYMLTGIVPSGRSYMTIGVKTVRDDGEAAFFSVGGVTIDGKVSYATEIDVPELTVSMPEPDLELGTLRFATEHGESTIKLRATNQGVPITNLPPCYEAIGLQGNPGELIYHDWRLDIEWDGEKGVGGWEPCIRTD